MNAISGIGSSQMSMMMQQMRAGGGSLQKPSAEMQAQLGAAAEAAGLDPAQIENVRGELQTAVESALKSYDGSGDPRAAMESAINGVLEKNGIDPADFKSKMGEVMKGMGMPDPSQMRGALGGGFSGTNGLSFDAGSSQNDLMDSLMEMLESDDETSSNDRSRLLDHLKDLPAGSLFNQTA